ncbi:MAG: hypothetical protein M1812_002261 [Candelaria pacifica]|nr:MAG: hypothetical protein M1812_002261 [Candelaria pacifica]
MPKIRQYAFAAVFAPTIFGILPAVTSTISSPSWPLVSTCPARTINYITHTLPQKCLRTSWASAETASTVLEHAVLTASGDGSPWLQTQTSETAGQTTPLNAVQDVKCKESNIDADALPRNSGNASSTDSASSAVQAVVTEHSSAPSTVSTGYTASILSPSGSSLAEPDAEADSPLDNANFLSFEDWKNKNLERAGQSAEHVGKDRPPSSGGEPRRRPGSINNALDSLGEDSEIELEFGGFTDSRAPGAPSPSSRNVGNDRNGRLEDQELGEATATGIPRSAKSRSKDAGKTYKERFNYASFDCAATVLKTNKQCKGTSSILVENKDSYMLNECAAPNKFLIVELCNDILVDTVVLANFEFFSSMFRTFMVSVSDRYPVKLDKWRILGAFEARNTREVQAFLVENPLIWARYLRIEFLSHFGNEFYCPVSLLRVHGTTMMEEFRHQEEAARGEEDVGMEEDEPEGTVDGTRTNAVEAEELRDAIEGVRAVESDIIEKVDQSKEAVQKSSKQESTTIRATDTGGDMETASGSSNPESTAVRDSRSSLQVHIPETPFSTNDPVCQSTQSPTIVTAVQSSTLTAPASEASPRSMSNIKIDPVTDNEAVSVVSSNAPSGNEQLASASKASSNSVGSTSLTTATPTTKASHQVVHNTSKLHASATNPPPANPTTQESFFKTIHKRLQLLETNSTLSLKYIEEQSRNLRDAFMKVEKRQLAKTTTFLENLNTTVLTELKEFRQQYDQIWQSTVIELESQREQSQREIVAVSARLSILADELVFQKRMSIVQSMLILLCLGLAIFSRGVTSSYLELPLVNNLYARSQSTIRSFDSPPGSPSFNRLTSSRQRKSGFGLSRSHSREHSEGSTSGARSPTLEFSPPTPTTDEGSTDQRSGTMSSSSSPEPLRRRRVRDEVQSSPATPSGTRGPRRVSVEWHGNDFRESGLLRPDVIRRSSQSTKHDDEMIIKSDVDMDEMNGSSEESKENRVFTPLEGEHATLNGQRTIDGHRQRDVNGSIPAFRALPSPPPEKPPEALEI